MTQTQTYTHPNSTTYRITQILVLIGLIVLLLTIPLQIMIAVLFPQAMLFYMSAIITLLFVAPLLLYLVTTPTVSLSAEGMTIHPFIGKPHHLTWDEIDRVAYYPLLPRQNHEVNKRLVVGRKRYKPAEGIMLISSKLPQVYRIGGFFAGERGRKIIALTNRTHTNYDYLHKQVIKQTQTDLNDS